MCNGYRIGGIRVGGLRVCKTFVFFVFKQKTAYELSACLVGSEMCIRGRPWNAALGDCLGRLPWNAALECCLGILP